MSDGPEWFAPKRYGIGTGLPISWQGWALTLGFLATAFAVSLAFKDKPTVMIAVMVPAAAVFVVVARTTRGGWRWRWGEDD